MAPPPFRPRRRSNFNGRRLEKIFGNVCPRSDVRFALVRAVEVYCARPTGALSKVCR